MEYVDTVFRYIIQVLVYIGGIIIIAGLICMLFVLFVLGVDLLLDVIMGSKMYKAMTKKKKVKKNGNSKSSKSL